MATAIRAPAAGQRSDRQTVVVVAVLTALAVAVRLFRLVRPGVLFGATNYDDGVYFGDAVQLVHGRLPYRDFVAVHPPLIMVLMAPLAAMSSVIGTAKGLALARLLTVAVGAAAVPLVGRLLRGKSVAAVALGCAVVALYPDGVRAGSFLELEPWLVLFCLVGLLVVFDGATLRSGRALVWGGVLFGLAGSVKVWAIAPVVVLAVLLLRRGADLARFAAGVAIGFSIVVLPFAVAAPRQFVRQVLSAQAGRQGPDTATGVRLSHWLGMDYVGDEATARPLFALALVTFFVLGVATALHLLRWRRRRPEALELFAAGTAVTVLIMFWVAQQYYYHYGAFLAPWVALVIALAAAPDPPRHARGRDHRWRLAWAAGVGGLLAASCVALLVSIGSERAPIPVAARINRAVPAGACVVSNQAAALLVADRFTSDDPNCPALVDPYGIALVVAGGQEFRKAQADPVVRREWLQAVQRAQYVAWSPYFRQMTPITYLTHSYLRSHFRRVRVRPEALQIYRRTSGAPASQERS